MAKCNRADLAVKLLIVGDGDALEELQRKRAELGLEDYVVLAGKQPYEKIPEFIAASDICLLPAHDNAIMRDIVPIKMYEYMAMGKPVIATRLHGLLREFGDDNGVLWIDQSKDSLKKSHGTRQRGYHQNTRRSSEAICSYQRLGHGRR